MMKKVLFPIVLLIVLFALVVPMATPAMAATTTLEPSGGGSLTQLTLGAGSSHWSACTSSDGDTSYVQTGNATWKTDLYAMPNRSLAGPINSVTVYMEARSAFTPDQVSARTAIQTDAVVYYGTPVTLTASYTTHSTTYATNPSTTSAWTWPQINDLQAGVSLRSSNSSSAVDSRCTYVSVVVDYAPISPGITVEPTSGLVTTENNSSATFTIVLKTQPTNDVTIGLSSSDLTEGMVSPTSVTFTSAPGNWSTPRTVTVTGLDDALVDGNIPYTIVTAAAISSDISYVNMNASDVSVTNNDNEPPPTPAPTLAPPTPSPTPAPTPGPSPTPVVANKRCFIATAAYGSSLDSHVDTLRNFRDAYLETNPLGSAFVSLYYKVSPPMAAFIDEHPTLKPIVRAGLWPSVAMSSVALNTTLAEKAVILVAIALFAAVLIKMWLMRRTRRLERR